VGGNDFPEWFAYRVLGGGGKTEGRKRDFERPGSFSLKKAFLTGINGKKGPATGTGTAGRFLSPVARILWYMNILRQAGPPRSQQADQKVP
jgi:hypothetical protein